MNELFEHAKRELKLTADTTTAKDIPVRNTLIELVAIIAEAQKRNGLGGGSTSVLVSTLQKLVNGQVLTPLTGEKDEWRMTIPEARVMQNIRYPWVFKDVERAWDTNAIWYQFEDEMPYSRGDLYQDITFPYTPTTTIVKVDEDGHPLNRYDRVDTRYTKV